MTQQSGQKNGYKPLVPAVDQAVKLLMCMGQSKDSSMNLTQICKEIGIHKSKGHSILKTLMQYNFITKDLSTKTYSLGPGLLFLAKNVHDNLDINKIACPYLKALANETKSTVLLGTIVNDQFFITSTVESDETIGITVRKYESLHITHGAHGKVITAFSNPEEQNRLLGLEDLCFYGKNKPFDKKDLYKELKLVLKNGYAVDNGQVTQGIMGISSPIFDHQNKLAACIVIVGTFPKNKIKEYGKKVALISKNISKDFGAVL